VTLFKKRKMRKEIAALWKPEYSRLAQYNAERGRGIHHTPTMVRCMAEVQQDFDTNYTPAVQAVKEKYR
jgi:hypothetical protein